MNEDYKDLLSVFNAHNVRYLVIGGWAYSYHVEPRATKDLDVFIESSDTNAKLVYNALLEYGAPMAGTSVSDFHDGRTTFQIGVDPRRIDVIQKIDGITFEQAWGNRIIGGAARNDSLQVNYMAAADLIQNKTASGRLRDLADVEDLNASLKANKKD